MHILFTHFRRFRSGFIQVCFCLGILLLGGCDMIEYHPYDLDIDGETVNVATAANLAMVTAYVLYAKDVFSKLSKLVLSKTSGTPEQTGGTTPPALEEPADAAEATAAE